MDVGSGEILIQRRKNELRSYSYKRAFYRSQERLRSFYVNV
jgi:hypothetical protein